MNQGGTKKMTREGERELVKVERVNGGEGYIVRETMVTS